jgi:cell wall-associated NlpC family hydrolase
MASKAGLSGLALAEIVFGAIFVYTGIYGLPVGYTLKYLLQGKVPPVTQTGADTLATVESADLSATGGTTPFTGSPASNSALASYAETFVGHKYVYGGPSNPTNGWDCSSFVSYCLGHFSIAIPGGSWASVTGNGSSHGPTVASYVVWGGATTISKSQVIAGDLIMYPPDTHMGIAVSSTEFVSAEDPADGTGIAPMSDGPGAWIARRIVAAVAG